MSPEAVNPAPGVGFCCFRRRFRSVGRLSDLLPIRHYAWVTPGDPSEVAAISVALAGAKVYASAIDGRHAFVILDSAATGLDCCHLERRTDSWTFVGGGGGSGHIKLNWVRSELAPPGVVGIGGRSSSAKVRVELEGDSRLVRVVDGYFAAVFLGVQSSRWPKLLDEG